MAELGAQGATGHICVRIIASVSAAHLHHDQSMMIAEDMRGIRNHTAPVGTAITIIAKMTMLRSNT